MHSSAITRKVLVVEDESLLRMELADEMTAAGWTVAEAASGEAALAMLAEAAGFELLVTDIRLAGTVNGWEVAKAFHEKCARAPVVYVSANPDLPGRRVEGSVFLGKPCNIDRLLEICDRLTG
jgi:DNA-binding NtrC family response regulator